MKKHFALTFLSIACLGATQASLASNASYVALGDSYTSGVGTDPSYTDACMRTSLGYPYLLAQDGRIKNFENLACSGATTSAVERDQVPLISPSATMLTLTVGGDDLGFAKTATTCIALELMSEHAEGCQQALQEMSDQASSWKFVDKLSGLYVKILDAAPQARLYVLNYPRLFTPPRLQPRVMSAQSRSQANAVVDVISDAIETAVMAANESRPGGRITFVDVRPIFEDHGVTGTIGGGANDWVNFVNTSNVKNALHPNPTGYREGYLQALTKADPFLSAR